MVVSARCENARQVLKVLQWQRHEGSRHVTRTNRSVLLCLPMQLPRRRRPSATAAPLTIATPCLSRQPVPSMPTHPTPLYRLSRRSIARRQTSRTRRVHYKNMVI